MEDSNSPDAPKGANSAPEEGNGHLDGEPVCSVCMDTIRDQKTLKCLHTFCGDCIDSVFRFKPACPICNTFYGTFTGTQPEGTMTLERCWYSLPGYEDYRTIVIDYSFDGGIQGPEHPNPGQRYTGTYRRAYLPASEEGEKVLRLLQIAFKRRLVFTIGRSATTGYNNVITWNDIHHKTNTSGGPQCFGYPDPEYLCRVQEELRLKGVTEDN